MDNFVVSIYGACNVNTKYHFLEELKEQNICFYNSKTVEEKQDPTENDQYYLVNSDLLVVVVDDPRNAKTLRDVTMVHNYAITSGKPAIFVLPNKGKFGRDRDSLYNSVSVNLMMQGVEPLYSLEAAFSKILEERNKKLASQTEEETVDVKLDNNGQKVSISEPTDAE